MTRAGVIGSLNSRKGASVTSVGPERVGSTMARIVCGESKRVYLISATN
jgi:hypothetical protein